MKNVKVFEIVSRLNNGHYRTVHAIVPLETTITEICGVKNIPILSITYTKVTSPMTMNEAMEFVYYKQSTLIHDSNNLWIKTTVSIEEAA